MHASTFASMPEPADAGGRSPLAAIRADTAVEPRHTLSAPQGALLTTLFAVAIFVNAAMLFAVQPMFSKMVLPLLGGAPAIWNTCLLFFQSALLVGYLYAHVTSRRLEPRTQAMMHLGLMLAALAVLPIAIPAAWRDPPASALPVGWLLALLTIALGLPFVVLSAGAPMLQRWFSTTRHGSAHNPYFLYAASNLGSFAALLAYPFVLEPRLRLSEQSVWWQALYYVLIGLIGACAVVAYRLRQRHRLGGVLLEATTGDTVTLPPDADEPELLVPAVIPNRHWRLRWVLLAFAPSSLLIGVTTYLSTDIASVPFLWVIPLALYLLTFVLVFARRPPLNRRFMLFMQLVLGLALMVALCVGPGRRISTTAGLHLLAFFATAMVCHRELADSRPRVEHLTEFYLWISLGGVLGGIFNVLLAPLLYRTLVEYPFAIVIALGLRPTRSRTYGGMRGLLFDVLLPAVIALVIWGAWHLPTPPADWASNGTLLFLGAMALVVASFWRRPFRLALGAGALYFGVQMAAASTSDVVLERRSFFGVYRVRELFEYNLLQNGTTTHGGQSRQPSRRQEPLTYYYRGGPLGELFESVLTDRPLRRVAVVGLGTGTIACYGRPGESWTFFEVDPLVEWIASRSGYFTYLRDCPPTVNLVTGDARLSLSQAPDSTFDLIILDAFTSDAIPVHLVTQEALALYFRKLRPGGVVVFHISNRYVDLRPVLISLANDARVAGALGEGTVDTEERAKLYYASRWIALARRPGTLAALVRRDEWSPLGPSPTTRLWTDDYSDVLGVLVWH